MLCLVLDVAAASDTGRLEALFAAGVDWMQLRDRHAEARDLLDATDRALAAQETAHAGTRVLVNRRCDVALAAGAHGAHLGFDALAPEAARRLLGAPALLGASLHEPGERSDAELQALDYVHLAPIHTPISKPASRPPLGTDALARMTARGVPVLAQGGVSAERAAACVAAGARGVAVTGEVLRSPDPAEAAGRLRSALDG